jgi:hypothetical protein
VKKTIKVTNEDADFIQMAFESKNAQVKALDAENARAKLEVNIAYNERVARVFAKYGLAPLPADFKLALLTSDGKPIRPAVVEYDDPGQEQAPDPLNGKSRVAQGM